MHSGYYAYIGEDVNSRLEALLLGTLTLRFRPCLLLALEQMTWFAI